MLKIKNQKRDPLVPPLSISALYSLSSFQHLNHTVVNQKEFNYTRRELSQDRRNLAKVFLELGVKPGDIILVATSRSMYENIAIFLAANRLGAIVSFLDEKTARDTLLHYLEEFNSSLLITYKYSDKRIKDIKHNAKSLKNVINIDGYFVDNGDPDDEQTETIKASVLDHMWLGKKKLSTIAKITVAMYRVTLLPPNAKP